jgi:hypothetical protein
MHPAAAARSSPLTERQGVSADRPGPGIVTGMPDGSRRFGKPVAALGVLATMASIWWFALRPRRKIKTGGSDEKE